MSDDAVIRPIGHVRSSLVSRAQAPRQGDEGAPDAWLELDEAVATGLDGLAVGDEVIVLTWFHQARRDVLKLHPRGDPSLPISGVFTTRSPDWPIPGVPGRLLGQQRRVSASGLGAAIYRLLIA